jgi:hypothetical protein
MRPVLTILLAATIATPALAQSEAFNPYQATLDRMPLAEAQPAIEAAYGAPVDTSPGVAGSKDKSALVLTIKTTPNPSFFLFCHERMAGFSAPVAPVQAGEIINAQTGLDKPLPDVYGTSDGLTVSLLDRALSVSYLGVGTPQSRVEMTYPLEVFTLFNMDELCAGLAD